MPDRIDYFGTGTDAGDFSFLSNFFLRNGWTVEHHYQAAKTDDPKHAQRILSAKTPKEAKQLGRQCPMREGWDDQKLSVMRALLRVKFTDPWLAKELSLTGRAELVEGNYWGDTYWGVSNNTGEGENWLGKLLMEVRDALQYGRLHA